MSVDADNRIKAVLQSAIAYIKSGDMARAVVLLDDLIAQRPAEPAALGILGYIRYREGRLNESFSLLSRSLASDPRQIDVRVNAAYVLRDLGRTAEAIDAFRAIIAAKPALWEAHLRLGDLLHQAGELADAEASYRRALALVPSCVEAGLGLGRVLLAAGDSIAAEQVLRAALGTTEDRALVGKLEEALASALQGQHRLDEAAAAYGRAQAADPSLAAVEYRRACLLQETGRFEEAIALFERALSRAPENIFIHRDYNNLLYRLGREDEFLRSYDRHASADRNALRLEKAAFLIAANRADEARDTFLEILRRDPDNTEAAAGCAVALTRMKLFDDALAQFEALLGRLPDDAGLYGEAAAVLAQLREPAKAAQMARRGLACAPFDQGCLAVLGTTYRMTDDPRAARHNGYDTLVRAIDLEPPPGFADMASFNRKLDAYLDRLHPPLREFVGQTLRGGSQTTNHIFGAGHELVEKLRPRIDDAIRCYVAELGADEEHPFVTRRGRGFAYSGSWSSRLRDGGYHVNHLHTAWISACYYVAVPEASRDAISQEGWIKFGEPSYDVGLAAPVARAIQPVPGRLVLFPSYTWHGTRPFRSESQRTTIAFDVMPA